MSTIARHDGWRGSGCSLAGTTLALGESKTLKQRRCAACGGMHVDGERSSPKHGSNLAGKCPPPPQAAGHPTLRDGSTSAIPAEPPSPVITVSAALAFRKHQCENSPLT